MTLNELVCGHAFKYGDADEDPVKMAPSTLVKPICMVEDYDCGIEPEDRLRPLSELDPGTVFQVHNTSNGLIMNYWATDGSAISGRVVLALALPSALDAEMEIIDCGYAGQWFSPGATDLAQ